MVYGADWSAGVLEEMMEKIHEGGMASEGVETMVKTKDGSSR